MGPMESAKMGGRGQEGGGGAHGEAAKVVFFSALRRIKGCLLSTRRPDHRKGLLVDREDRGTLFPEVHSNRLTGTENVLELRKYWLDVMRNLFTYFLPQGQSNFRSDCLWQCNIEGYATSILWSVQDQPGLARPAPSRGLN